MALQNFGSLSFSRTTEGWTQDHSLSLTFGSTAVAAQAPTHVASLSTSLQFHSIAEVNDLSKLGGLNDAVASGIHAVHGGDMLASPVGAAAGESLLAFGLGAATLVTDHNLSAIGMSHAAGVQMGTKLQLGLADLYVASQMNGLAKLDGLAAYDAIKAVTASNTLLQMYVEGADSHGRGGQVMVAVDFVAADGNGAGLLDALHALGLTHGGAYGAMAGGYIPIEALDSLAKMDALAFARPVYAMTDVGLTTNQGVQSQNVDYLQSDFGFNGSGVTIGVMSDSFDTKTTATTHYAQDITNGDLPSGITILKDKPAPAGTDEGRGMAQQAYDIAPGAAFKFYTAFVSEADFANGVNALAAAGCDIIVDDVRYYAEPMFQDGIVAQAVAAAVAGGSMYFSSAGNNTDNAYMSTFNASATTVTTGGVTYTLHDFDAGAGVDTRMRMSRTGTTIFDLQWAQPFKSVSPGSTGATSDLAILFYNATTGALIGAVNTANVGADPVEIAQLTGSGNVDIAIGWVATSATPGLFKLDVFNSTANFTEWDTHSATAWGHNNAAGAIAVAASDWVDSARFGTFPFPGEAFPYAETFTSKGGQQILFDTAGNLLASPLTRDNVKFTASDGGNTTFFGTDVSYDADTFPNFYGTSSAAPNAAAIAALLMQAFPAATNVQIQAAMAASALDIKIDYNGNATGVGTDLTTGTGLIQADAALALLHTLFAPTVNNDAVTTDEDTAIVAGSVFADNGSGADTDPNNILFVTQVNGLAANVGGEITLASGAHLTVNHNGTFSYNPNGQFESLGVGDSDTDSFTYTLHGGGTATVTITINGVDDATVAKDDAFTTDEDTAFTTGNVFNDNGSGADTDVDSTPTVTEVNGSAASVGNQITLASGALLTLNADGTFSYDPNGAFDSLPVGNNGSDSFTYTTVGGDTATVTFTINGVDDASVANNDAFTVDEDSSLTSDNVFADNGSGADTDVDSTLTVTEVNGSASDVGTQITLASGALLTLNADGTFDYDTNGAFDSLNAAENGSDSFTYTLAGGDTATVNLTITGVDDYGVANDDAFSTSEDTALSSGNVFDDNGSGADTDADDIVITEVNGSGANIGTQITLASGALLTLNADGTFSYDPNHAFDDLPAAGSGASNLTATDTFTYTVAGGDAATVTITVNGVDSDDTLQGTNANDTMYGGIGNDVIYARGGNDTLYGGDGDDEFRFIGKFRATDSVTGGSGSDQIVLNGDYSAGVVFGAATMSGVESIKVTHGKSYNLTTHDANVGAGETLTVNAKGLHSGDSMVFNGSSELDGNFRLFGGAGSDTLTGGARNDKLDGGAGTDALTGGDGRDEFTFSAGQGNGDSISDFDGRGTKSGDSLVFDGYGAGATFSQIDATHWMVASFDHSIEDIITFSNAASIHVSDYTFI